MLEVEKEEAEKIIAEYYQLKNNSFKLLTFIMLNAVRGYSNSYIIKDQVEELAGKLKISVNTFYLAKKDLMAKKFIEDSYYSGWEISWKTRKLSGALKKELENSFKDRL